MFNENILFVMSVNNSDTIVTPDVEMDVNDTDVNDTDASLLTQSILDENSTITDYMQAYGDDELATDQNMFLEAQAVCDVMLQLTSPQGCCRSGRSYSVNGGALFLNSDKIIDDTRDLKEIKEPSRDMKEILDGVSKKEIDVNTVEGRCTMRRRRSMSLKKAVDDAMCKLLFLSCE